MTTEEEISRNQDERNKTRHDLRNTWTEVNAKVERAGRDLRPDHLVESYPVAASLVAGAFGFFIGSSVEYRVTGPIAIAVLLGFALSRRSSREESGRDDRETSSTAPIDLKLAGLCFETRQDICHGVPRPSGIAISDVQ